MTLLGTLQAEISVLPRSEQRELLLWIVRDAITAARAL